MHQQAAQTPVQHIDWEPKLALRTAGMKSSIIRELLKLAVQPDLISFAGGLPAPELFPVREIEEACRHILATDAAHVLQYSTTEGHPPLRQWLADAMSFPDLRVEPDNIIITNGSQQALDLIGKLFVEPGSCVMTSEPTYLGALQAWNVYQACYVTVPQDDDGILVDRIPALLATATQPRLLYVLPNFHNPAGVTIPLDRRLELVRIAREHDLILVEDDPYGELRFEGEPITHLYRLAPERTIYLSTFSKTLAPGLRIGWVTAPKTIIQRFVQAKQGADLHTGTFAQAVVADVCQRGLLHGHVRKICSTYHERRDAMLAALGEHWPEGCSWTRPHGGLFLWARIPEGLHAAELLPKAVERKVAYVPGMVFYPGEAGGFNAMRLNFSNAGATQIQDGIRRLGDVIREAVAARPAARV
ncbi:MAG: PLP-dependent aminotransferase family protein [Gemmatimonadota bacterium]